MSEEDQYLPFRGLSAWFSSSVHPDMVKQWDRHGGSYEDEYKADFLFSDNAYAEDTVRVYGEQEAVGVFSSSWVREVLEKHTTVPNIAPGRHILIPHFANPIDCSQPFTTPERRLPLSKLMQVQVKPRSLQRHVDSTNKRSHLREPLGYSVVGSDTNVTAASSIRHFPTGPEIIRHSAIVNVSQLEPLPISKLVDFIPDYGGHQVVRK